MDSNAIQIVAAVLGSAAVTSVLGVLAKGLVDVVKGTAGRERLRNAGLKEQREDALRRERKAKADGDRSDALADLEAYNRRLTEEYASAIRRDCTELHYHADGRPVTREDLRHWPALRRPPQEQEPHP
jgi:hypothetical protein